MTEIGSQTIGETVTEVERPARRAARRAKEMVERQKLRAEELSHKMDAKAEPVFSWLTGGAIVLSLILFLRKSKENATFVGLWAPTFLGLGLLRRLAHMRWE